MSHALMYHGNGWWLMGRYLWHLIGWWTILVIPAAMTLYGFISEAARDWFR